MSDPLYAKPLLRLAANAIGAGRLNPHDAEGHAHNPTCGDRVSVTLRFDEARPNRGIALNPKLAC
jgi:NifU-like protein involved in Fe-S cluster formation